MNDAGYLANRYRLEAASYRDHARFCFRYGYRAEGRDAMHQAIRCWKRFRLWMARTKETNRGNA